MAEFLTDAELDALYQAAADAASSMADFNARKKKIDALVDEAAKARIEALQLDLRRGAPALIDLMDRILGHADALLGQAGLLDSAAARALRAQIGAVQAEVHDRDALGRTFKGSDGVLEVTRDEMETRPAGPAEQVPAPAAPPSSSPPELPELSTLKSYADLAQEYQALFARAEPRPIYAATVADLATRVARRQARYQAAGEEAGGVPWWFIGALHLLESSCNFEAHLHNGDPLTARTRRVPAGRPKDGSPPFTWEESAADALRGQKLNDLKDWSLPRALWRWERYNGFGYRNRRNPTPYLWGLSTIYERGKFTSDGVYDPDHASSQCGAGILLKALMREHGVTLGELRIDEGDETESAPAEAPAEAPADFAGFFASNFGPETPFVANELLVKGASHAANGLNTDPPKELWENCVPLVRALSAIRKAAGASVRLTSVYRSPAYNERIGGAKQSQHMRFCAADMVIDDGRRPADWAALAKRLRAEGVFSGGVGLYPGFVHIDVRGVNVNF